jgi:hypothetical protein
MKGMATSTPPSRLARMWGSSAVAPSRLVLLAEPFIGAATDEDAFSGGDGGEWFWYLLAGSMRPRALPGSWRVAGRGAGAVGTLTRIEGRARFIPARFWKRRGVPEWERVIKGERADGEWLTLSFEDGEAVLRHRKGDVS